MRARVLLLAALILGVASPSIGQDAFASAQNLYASAQYEDALRVLDGLAPGAALLPPEKLRIEQIRVLCLLALERPADAQQAIEAILQLDPFYQPGEDEAAPKVRAAFREVRRRALPGVLQRLYDRAKQSYDKKAYDEAAAAFKRVLTLLDDPDLTLDSGALADMRLVAKAFLDLSQAAAAPPPPPAAPSPPPHEQATDTAGASPPARPPADSAPVRTTGAGGSPSQQAPEADGSQPKGAPKAPLFDAAAPDVVRPVPLRSDVDIPELMKPVGSERAAVVEVVVSAAGAVESATIRQGGGSVFDDQILRSVMLWRFRPATRNGAPVRYRMLVRVIIPPRGAAVR